MVYQEYRRDDSKTDHVAHANLENLGAVRVDTALEYLGGLASLFQGAAICGAFVLLVLCTAV